MPSRCPARMSASTRAVIAAGPWAIVLFEAPHRVARTLADLYAALGERDVVVCRELTKRFEVRKDGNQLMVRDIA